MKTNSSPFYSSCFQQLRMPGKFSQKAEQMDVNLRLQSKLAMWALFWTSCVLIKRYILRLFFQAQSIRMTTALSCFKLIASPSGSSLAFSIKLMQQRRSLYDWIGEMNLLPQHLTCSSKWLRGIVSTLEILISLQRLNTGQLPDHERQSNRLNRNVLR